MLLRVPQPLPVLVVACAACAGILQIVNRIFRAVGGEYGCVLLLRRLL